MKLSTLLNNLPPELPIRAKAAAFPTVGDYLAALNPPPWRWAFIDPEVVVRVEGAYLSIYQQPPSGCYELGWLAAIELPPVDPAEETHADGPGAE